MKTNNSSSFKDTKPHYDILDGLRGVAALMVVWYHIHEGFAFAAATNGVGDGLITSINHGYLAVDFFFMLSGFVISYAYDDRWGKMTIGNFFKRRLIRLHPMLIMGTVIGTVSFMAGGSLQWDGTHISIAWVLAAMLLTCFFIPAIPGAGYEVRGNGEMFPLNGPSWSLFFEYIGNILYGLFIHRFSSRVLMTVSAALGAGWAFFALNDISGYGSMGVGWTLDAVNFTGGMLRMFFPFTVGMVLARHFSPWKIKGAFWTCSVIIILSFFVPYIQGSSPVCMNSLYELACVAVIFPLTVWMGASGSMSEGFSKKICDFLGNISYPLYIVHYPVMYLFYQYLIKNELYTLDETLFLSMAVCVVSVILAYVCLKFYDIPVRRMLTSRFVKKDKKQQTI